MYILHQYTDDPSIIKNTTKKRVDRFVTVKNLVYDPHWKIAVSPLILTPDELRERLSIGDDFIEDILTRGVVLYEREDN
jgi:hypothetical protein